MEDRMDTLMFLVARDAANETIDSVNKILRRSREDGYEIEKFDVTVCLDDEVTIKVGANAIKKDNKKWQ